ncbi:MAG: hypothetical protein R3C11_15695 [Planctomycetaceae bacterium]
MLFERQVTYPYWCSGAIMLVAGLLLLTIRSVQSLDAETTGTKPEPAEVG